MTDDTQGVEQDDDAVNEQNENDQAGYDGLTDDERRQRRADERQEQIDRDGDRERARQERANGEAPGTRGRNSGVFDPATGRMLVEPERVERDDDSDGEEASSPGSSSESFSGETPSSTPTTGDDGRATARTTAQPSKNTRTAASGARSTGGSGTDKK